MGSSGSKSEPTPTAVIPIAGKGERGKSEVVQGRGGLFQRIAPDPTKESKAVAATSGSSSPREKGSPHERGPGARMSLVKQKTNRKLDLSDGAAPAPASTADIEPIQASAPTIVITPAPPTTHPPASSATVAVGSAKEREWKRPFGIFPSPLPSFVRF
jgi:hypothetical protein